MNKRPHARLKESEQQPDDQLHALADLRRSAPHGFKERVVAAVSELDKGGARQDHRGWLVLSPVPRLVGALAAIAIVVLALVVYWQRPLPNADVGDRAIYVEFQLNAPSAAMVELVGDFTAWQAGQVRFDGPDAQGNWKARIPLAEGRYEYLFLVDGQDWVTDASAPAHRPDGFGNLNAIINL